MSPALRCPACEQSGVVKTALGAITDDGQLGEIAGFACRSCGYIREENGAALVVTGRVDLHGLTALEWMLTGLRAAGCDPRPRR